MKTGDTPLLQLNSLVFKAITWEIPYRNSVPHFTQTGKELGKCLLQKIGKLLLQRIGKLPLQK